MAAEPKPPDDGPVVADESEVDAVRQLGQLLNAPAQDKGIAHPVRFTAPDGQVIDLPVSVRAVLRQVVPLLAQGDAVAITSLHKELTTQEAADILNVSRPFLIKLLEEGTIPYTKVGDHRRVRLNDVLAHRAQRHEEFKEFAAWMLAVAQEHNAYDYV